MKLLSNPKSDFWKEKKGGEGGGSCAVPKETAIVFILVNGPLPPVCSKQGKGKRGDLGLKYA